MSFDMTRLRRFNPDEELTNQEIKDLKDGVPNYGPDNGFVEVQGPDPLHEYLCGECTGSGIMLGFYPCKPCGGKGYIVPEPAQLPADLVDWANVGMVVNEIVVPIVPEPEPRGEMKELMGFKKSIESIYPNSRELSLLNNRIATLKAQLSKEFQKKKSERSQRDIDQLQQSINTLTKWKTPKN